MNSKLSSWGVIFDLDGTMVNNTAYHRSAWFELCRRHGITLTHADYHEKIHARSNDKIVPNLFGPHIDTAFIKKIQEEKETIYQDSFRPVLRETPGLSDFLEALNTAGVPCAAASNSPKTNVDFVLDGLNLRRFFKSVLDRDQVTIGKPNPEIFLKSAAALNLPPHRCLVFEDSSSGFAAARNAGMPYIAIVGGTDPSELPDAYDAMMQCDDFTPLTIQDAAECLTEQMR